MVWVTTVVVVTGRDDNEGRHFRKFHLYRILPSIGRAGPTAYDAPDDRLRFFSGVTADGARPQRVGGTFRRHVTSPTVVSR